MKSSRAWLGIASIALVASACSAKGGGGKFNNFGGNTSGTSNGAGASVAGTTSSGMDLFDGGMTTSGTNSSGTGQPCTSGPNDDNDHDGWTVAQGDCNDCDPNVNPGAVDVPAMMAMGDAGATMATDNNCDMKIETDVICDGQLAINEPNAMTALKAIELCHAYDPMTKWGVKSAKWVLPDGSPAPQTAEYDLGHGILNGFGPNVKVQGGKQMLALSSGTARAPGDVGYQDVGGFDKGYTSGSPAGFPKESPACPGITTGEPHDGVALEAVIGTPSNVTGFKFQFNFFTYEWPDYECSTFNDFFVALLTPIPMGQKDGNISFDSKGNPVSVNNAFLDVCGCLGGPPCMAGGKNFACSLGNKYLMGTGFGSDTAFGQDHGSTYWLETTAPVKPSSDITIRFTVYDSGDGVLDSSTLIDHWQWLATPGTTVGTNPVDNPK